MSSDYIWWYVRTKGGNGKSLCRRGRKSGGHSDEEDGNRIVQDIENNGQEAIFVKADVTNKSEIEAVIDKALEIYGQIDILYNGAGIHDGYDNWVKIELLQQTDGD